jgi:hypothetical protein
MLTEELCIAAIEDGAAPDTLGKIPQQMRTIEVCWTAYHIDDDALQYAPENLQQELKERKAAITEQQWLEKLSWYKYTSGHYLKPSPKLLTPDFCRRMVEMNGYTIELLPQKLVTPELCAIAENQTFTKDDETWKKETLDKIKMEIM